MFVLLKLPGKGRDLSRTIRDHIMSQAEAWAEELKSNPLPPFYQCGIRYRPEPLRAPCEEWVDPYTVKQRGYGDCDDMVIWRLAEILAKSGYDPIRQGPRNAPAHPAVARKRNTGRYHVLIRHSNGEFEDPANVMRDRLGEMDPKPAKRR